MKYREKIKLFQQSFYVTIELFIKSFLIYLITLSSLLYLLRKDVRRYMIAAMVVNVGELFNQDY